MLGYKKPIYRRTDTHISVVSRPLWCRLTFSPPQLADIVPPKLHGSKKFNHVAKKYVYRVAAYLVAILRTTKHERMVVKSRETFIAAAPNTITYGIVVMRISPGEET